jgi:membrane protein
MATTVKSQWVIEKLIQVPGFESAFELGFSQLPTLVLAGAFSFLYWFLPNTNVRAFSALLGGVFTALTVNAALAAYVGLSVGVARADALYGGFAQFPFFFVWVYVFWAIVLFGAEIAFAYQNLDLYVRQIRGERAGPAEREAIGLRIALVIARAFRDGSAPWTEDGLSAAMRVPVRTVREVLVPLEGAHIVTAIASGEREGAWQLGRPADAIQATDVLSALRGEREPVAGDADVTRAIESLLSELAQGERKAADGSTLASLLTSLPQQQPA